MTTTDDPLTRPAIDPPDARQEEEARALATLAGLEFADLSAHPVTESIAARLAEVLPEDVAREACLAAVGWRDETPVVAISAPESVLTIDDLARSLGNELIPVVASRSQIEQLIEIVYPPGREPKEQPPPTSAEERHGASEQPAGRGPGEPAGDAPVQPASPSSIGAADPSWTSRGSADDIATAPPGAPADSPADADARSSEEPPPGDDATARPDPARAAATSRSRHPADPLADPDSPDREGTGEHAGDELVDAGSHGGEADDDDDLPPPAGERPSRTPGLAADAGSGEGAAVEHVASPAGSAPIEIGPASSAPAPGPPAPPPPPRLPAQAVALHPDSGPALAEHPPPAPVAGPSTVSATGLARAQAQPQEAATPDGVRSAPPPPDRGTAVSVPGPPPSPQLAPSARAAAAAAGLEFVELEGFAIDLSAIDVLPEAFARRRLVAAVGWLDDVPIVATGSPGDVVLRDDVRSVAGRDVHFVGAEAGQIERYNERLFADRQRPEAPRLDADAEHGEALPAGSGAVTRELEKTAAREAVVPPPASVAAATSDSRAAEAPARPASGLLEGRAPARMGAGARSAEHVAVSPSLPATAGSPSMPPAPPACSLEQILLRDAKISDQQARSALDERARTGRTLREIFADRRYVSPAELYQAVAEEAGLEYVDLNEWPIDARASELVPESLARRYRLLAIGFTDIGQAIVGMANPSDVFAIDDLRTVLGREIEIVVCSPLQIDEYIPRLYRQTREVDRIIQSAARASEPAAGPEIRNLNLLVGVEDGPIVQFVNTVLRQALQQRASDVHIEPTADDMVVRFRIDGVMHHVTSTPKAIQGGVTTRLKVMADLDIAEHRIPQDGRISVNVGDRDVDLRVATLPTVHGEMVALRILDKSSSTLDLANLGFEPDVLKSYRSAYRKPYGTVLVTGPTGSGKSTTLYATLNQLNQPDRKLITIEDPVEYQIRGINQIQVNPRAGLTFANALRSILRSDPDVILVGEIRDKETATIAIEAALTGHLVLSSLHTNDAAGTPMRLVEMGVEPFLVGSALDCVVGQRLARVLCTVCSEVYHPSKDELAAAGWEESDAPDGAEPQFRRAVGCQACSRTGYRGRIAVQEVMLLTEEIERAVVTHAQTVAIQRIAEEQGMRTLRHDGLRKAARGLTSLEEILRVVV